MTLEVAAVVLAAGRATRFGAGPDTSKAYALLDGRALVAHVVAAARAAGAGPVVLVTGHAAHLAAAALRDAPADAIVHNADYPAGLAGSLRAGLAAVPGDRAGALILLADMPRVAVATLAALIGGFRSQACDAALPSFEGRRGNPVLLGRTLFAAAARLHGDEGARRLLRRPDLRILECPVDDPCIHEDVDTPEALQALTLRRR